jgi:hypothetical protein
MVPQLLHPIDKVIGYDARSAADIVSELAASPEFLEVVRRAIEEYESLGASGANFGTQVRIMIARQLQTVGDD